MRGWGWSAALAALVCPALAHAASCDAANLYAFHYSDQAAATLAYGSTYNYNATNGAGGTRAFAVTIAQNGLSNTQINNIQMPAISTLVTGASTTKADLVLGGVFSGRTTAITGTTRMITVTFTFATPIRDFSTTLHDIDYTANQFRDWVQVTGANGGSTYTPVLTTPWGTGNDGVLPHTSTSSSATLGATSTPLSLTSAQAGGSGDSVNNSDIGTIAASFAQPVTSVTIRYGNYPYTSGENTTGQQGMGIEGIAFCPLPAITFAKTSAPATGTYGAYNVPSNDVIYTLTVTNAGGSTVDAGSIVLGDVLPANLTFKNAAFDGTTSLPVKLVTASGTTLAAANVTYRQSGGSAFTYSPAAGYDAQVAEIRITPGGQLAANASMAVQFKAKIN
jgi:uncharacterized repeat protein (TIGR01451 family)